VPRRAWTASDNETIRSDTQEEPLALIGSDQTHTDRNSYIGSKPEELSTLIGSDQTHTHT
jgi:hypothetical protein